MKRIRNSVHRHKETFNTGHKHIWGNVFMSRVRAFFSVVRQMPGYNSQRGGAARTLPN